MIDFNSKEYLNYLEDQIMDSIGANQDYKYLDYLKDILQEPNYRKLTVLDVGAGSFNSWDWFYNKYKNKIQAIDIGNCIIDEMKKWPKRKATCMKHPLDAHRLNEYYNDETFDLIISFHSLEHMFDLPIVLKNINTVLKHGGYFYFSLPMPSVNFKKGHWYDVPNNETMIYLCKQAGFTKVLHDELVRDLRFRPQQEMICLMQK